MARGNKSIDYDVIIIGAGISGINFAYRLQERNPSLSYCIVDARHEIGGTWSLFKYPGIRSDSDLFTFGFPWRPWEEKEPIAQGSLILKYLKESAAEQGIDRNIKFNHDMKKMNWSSASSSWVLEGVANGSDKFTLRSTFLLLGTGYYDYNKPLQARIPGIEKYQGTVVHPQFWPKNLDYTNKNVIIIGSGATAVTLLPSIAQQAAHATMLQRSPSYILSLPEKDYFDKAMRLLLPRSFANRIIRLKWILSAFLLTTLCKWFPRLARAFFLHQTSRQLPKGVNVDPHFTPRYKPWEQRMCLCPGGDFYKSLRTGRASVETGVIETVTERSIKLSSGKELNPDIIITATGLKMHIVGGISIYVDGEPVSVPDVYFWKGCMLENVPNLFVSIGYVDASWTLGADATAQLACRMLSRLTQGNYSAIIPRLSDEEKAKMQELPLMSLNSTYVEKGKKFLPKVGKSPQWMPRSYYYKDMANAWWGDITTGVDWTR